MKKLTQNQKCILELISMGAWINGCIWFAALYLNNLIFQIFVTILGLGIYLVDAKLLLLTYKEDKK